MKRPTMPDPRYRGVIVVSDHGPDVVEAPVDEVLSWLASWVTVTLTEHVDAAYRSLGRPVPSVALDALASAVDNLLSHYTAAIAARRDQPSAVLVLPAGADPNPDCPACSWPMTEMGTDDHRYAVCARCARSDPDRVIADLRDAAGTWLEVGRALDTSRPARPGDPPCSCGAAAHTVFRSTATGNEVGLCARHLLLDADPPAEPSEREGLRP